jgi:hypothetical protein
MGSAAQWVMGSTDLRSRGLRRRVHIGASVVGSATTEGHERRMRERHDGGRGVPEHADGPSVAAFPVCRSRALTMVSNATSGHHA